MTEPLYCTAGWVKKSPAELHAVFTPGDARPVKRVRRAKGESLPKTNYGAACGIINHHVCILEDGHRSRCRCSCGSTYRSDPSQLDVVTEDDLKFGTDPVEGTTVSRRWAILLEKRQ